MTPPAAPPARARSARLPDDLLLVADQGSVA